MEGKGTDDQRNEFYRGFDICEPTKVLWVGYMEEVVCVCVIEMILY